MHRGAPADVAAAVVDDLGARGHLDDAAFARRWVETRSERGYGPGRMRAELAARGVARDLVEAALATLTPLAALDRARIAARRRLPSLRGLPPPRAAARLRGHLLRRGFAADIVRRVVRECAGVPAED